MKTEVKKKDAAFTDGVFYYTITFKSSEYYGIMSMSEDQIATLLKQIDEAQKGPITK